MDELILNIVYNILVVIITIASGYLVAWLRKKLGVEKMREIQNELSLKQELSEAAVRFAEQAYKDLRGPDKYHIAAEWLARVASEKGIKITDDEVKGLIESSLRLMKDKFGEEWANAVK